MSHVEHEVPYHGTFKGYATGFVLSILLTAAPFALAMNGSLPRSMVMVGIFLAAAVQVVVHLHYFLHLDMSPRERDNVWSLAFTGLIMLIFIAGTVWIMINLRERMMVDSPAMSMPGMSMSAPSPMHGMAPPEPAMRKG
jgi:cytochrome o ubiquinol oxidase operon protein cyoD